MSSVVHNILKKVRRVWTINPLTRFKKGNKKKRRRNKSKVCKELNTYLK